MMSLLKYFSFEQLRDIVISPLSSLLSNNQQNYANIFDMLPDDVILTIIYYLSLEDWRSLRLVNRRFNRISYDNSIYKNIWQKQYYFLFNACWALNEASMADISYKILQKDLLSINFYLTLRNLYIYFQKHINLTLLGCMDVGKTSLINSWTNKGLIIPISRKNSWQLFTTNTFAFPLNIKIWDYSGGAYLCGLTSKNYASNHQYVANNQRKNLSAVILFYDVCNPMSYRNVIDNYNMYKSSISKDCPFVTLIIANKADKILNRMITYEQGITLAKNIGAIYYDTSIQNDYCYNEIINGDISLPLRSIINKILYRSLYECIIYNQ